MFCTLLTKESRSESGYSRLPVWTQVPLIWCSRALWIMHLSYGTVHMWLSGKIDAQYPSGKRCPDWSERSREWRSQNRFPQEAFHSLWQWWVAVAFGTIYSSIVAVKTQPAAFVNMGFHLVQVTLQYLWEKEFQVLVFYHHPMALEVPFLWPGQMMPSPWANTTDPEKLVQFLQASITDRRSVGRPPWSYLFLI